MATYWIVVRPENTELFHALSVAFRGQSGISVISDRRVVERAWRRGERRGAALNWGPDEVIVAERVDPLPDDARVAV
jgi:hypothetical protein